MGKEQYILSKLQSALKKKYNLLSKLTPGPLKRYMEQVTKDIKNDGYESKALKVGDRIPDSNVINHLGEQVLLSELLKEQPTIISFYRGAWCPYCNLELDFYDQILQKTNNKNVIMFAISPEKPDVTMKKVDIEKLRFTVLSDVDNKLAKKFKLVFKLPKKLQILYRLTGINIKKSQANENWELPIPATYVIDSEGIVKSAWIDADYTKRAEPEEVIKAYNSIA
jgi:peroxiredoxin